MTDIAEEIKSRLTMREVAEMYGFKVGRLNKICCPFHSDKRPSLFLYPGKRGWFCFVCNTGGSVIDFVMRLFALNFLDACRKLNEDFHLGIPEWNELTDEQRRTVNQYRKQRALEMERAQAEENALLEAYHNALDRYIELDKQMIQNEPKLDANGDFELSEAYVKASYQIDSAWWEVEKAMDKMNEFERRSGNV